jgi:hypothetical protein
VEYLVSDKFVSIWFGVVFSHVQVEWGGGGCKALQIAFVLKTSVQRQYILVGRTPACLSFPDFLIQACGWWFDKLGP